MKKWALLLLLVLAAALLAGCGSSQESFPEVDSSLQQDPMTIPTDVPVSEPAEDPWANYDPASEEDTDDSYYVPNASYDDYGRQMYAGATPIPLDPVDMPTATPRPPLAFAYGDVAVDNIGLTFQAPVGWGIETPDAETVILTDPNAYDGVNATMTIRIVSVPATYKLSDVRTEVTNMLKDIGQYNFSSFSKTELATRTLLKKDGYYADYHGTYYDGTSVQGRVMVALLDNNRIITLHMVCDYGYFHSDYKGVVNHFRDTVKAQ